MITAGVLADEAGMGTGDRACHRSQLRHSTRLFHGIKASDENTGFSLLIIFVYLVILADSLIRQHAR